MLDSEAINIDDFRLDLDCYLYGFGKLADDQYQMLKRSGKKGTEKCSLRSLTFFMKIIEAAVQITLEQTACGINNNEFLEIVLFKIHHSFQDCFLNLFNVRKVLISTSKV